MNWILPFLSIPFKEFGRDRAGCDCWGLVRLVYRDAFGIALPDYLGAYSGCRDSDALGALIPEEARAWEAIPRGLEQPGDVIVLRMNGVPMHTGVVVSPGLMAHVHEGIDTAIEDYRRAVWVRRVIGFYRHKEFSPHVLSAAANQNVGVAAPV